MEQPIRQVGGRHVAQCFCELFDGYSAEMFDLRHGITNQMQP